MGGGSGFGSGDAADLGEGFLLGVVAGRVCGGEPAGRGVVWCFVPASTWNWGVYGMAGDVHDRCAAGAAGVLSAVQCEGVAYVAGGAGETVGGRVESPFFLFSGFERYWFQRGCEVPASVFVS